MLEREICTRYDRNRRIKQKKRKCIRPGQPSHFALCFFSRPHSYVRVGVGKHEKKVEIKTQNERFLTWEGYTCNASTHTKIHASDGIIRFKCIRFSKLSIIHLLEPWKVPRVRQVESVTNSSLSWFSYHVVTSFSCSCTLGHFKKAYLFPSFLSSACFLSFCESWVDEKSRFSPSNPARLGLLQMHCVSTIKWERENGSDQILFGDDCRPIMSKSQ